MSEEQNNNSFTPEEREKIRLMLKHEEHVAWFWSTARIWAMWITSVAGAVVVLWATFKEAVKGALQ